MQYLSLHFKIKPEASGCIRIHDSLFSFHRLIAVRSASRWYKAVLQYAPLSKEGERAILIGDLAILLITNLMGGLGQYF